MSELDNNTQNTLGDVEPRLPKLENDENEEDKEEDPNNQDNNEGLDEENPPPPIEGNEKPKQGESQVK